MDLETLDTLESTNQVLSDLERKLSINSTTSTQYSHASSVVINKLQLGIGKLNVSNVLSYINNSQRAYDSFDANNLYNERQRISRSKSSSAEPEHPLKLQQPLVQHKGKTALDYSDDEQQASSKDDTSTSNAYYGDYDYDYSDDDDYDDDDSSFDVLVPPSPPRSPPSEIDPDKLYGLYDFSGPDPLHCTLSRDEPVYLLNDEDNYWWLIQKLTKEERKDGVSDDEDGKIGFVPAECLETYGERLARLNCFKNEEIEKTNPSTSDLSVNKPLFSRPGTTTNNNNKSVTFEDLTDINSTGQMPLLSEDEDSDAGDYQNDDKQEFPHGIFSMPAGPIGSQRAAGVEESSVKLASEVFSDIFPDVQLVVNKNKIGKKRTPARVIEFGGEISQSSQSNDKYNDNNNYNDQKNSNSNYNDQKNSNYSPNNSNYNSNNGHLETQPFTHNSAAYTKPSASTSYAGPPAVKAFAHTSATPETTPTLPPSATLGFGPPRRPGAASDAASIGSYSPDTPPSAKSNYSAHSPEARLNDEKMLRRSVILERLNQVTADIQEQQIYLQDDLNYSDMEKIMFGMDSKEDLLQEGENDDANDTQSLDSTIRRSINVATSQDEEEEDCRDVSNETFTPFTSTASLVERSKDKSIHDMFVPILGKFDELAEKLEELNVILG